MVTMVTDTKGLGDQNFNDLANEGGTKAPGSRHQRKVDREHHGLCAESDRRPPSKAELVVGVGFLLTEAITNVANQYPDKFFRHRLGFRRRNVQSVLLGAADWLSGRNRGGQITKTNKIGLSAVSAFHPLSATKSGSPPVSNRSTPIAN